MTTHLSSLYKNKIVWALGLLAGALFMGLYIFQLNSLTTLAWRIAETEQHLSELRYQNTTLQTQAYQAVSFRDLEELAQSQNFRKVTSITYLKPLGASVAQNQ